MLTNRLFNKIMETRWMYKLSKSSVRVQGLMHVGNNVRIRNSYIYVGPKATLTIADNVMISDVGIYVYDGKFIIGEKCVIEREKNSSRPEYIVDSGASITIEDHVRLQCQRMWTRFGGVLNIDKYTNVNAHSEIRCDNNVKIGAYCQISYNTKIWDTNTHSIYSPDVRRQLAEQYYPGLGHENERPKTKPVSIGDDCWLGENVAILKGTTLEDEVIIGFNTVVSNCKIEKGKTVITKITNKIL